LEFQLLGVGVNSERLDPLRLNVGFLLHQSIGFSRIFEFDLEAARIDGDLVLTNLQGQLRMTRTAQGLYGQGRFDAHQTMACSRCLEDFQQPLASEIGELFVYPPQRADDPLLAIPESGILNLHPLLRETFELDIPLQPICASDCLGLCPICGNNRNLSSCDHPDEEIDPRFEVLKTLRFDT
jgi:uncharacterized protein